MIYLSVDLDYWTCRPEDFGGPEAADVQAEAFLRRVLAQVPDVILCVDHHQIVPHVNAAQVDRIINVDYHSDLPGLDCEVFELDEGSWGRYIDDPGTKDFEWRSATREDMPGRLCVEAGCNPFAQPGLSPYAETVHRTGLMASPRRMSWPLRSS